MRLTRNNFPRLSDQMKIKCVTLEGELNQLLRSYDEYKVQTINQISDVRLKAPDSVETVKRRK